MEKELFNQKTVQRLCSKIQLTPAQKTAAKEWLYFLDEGKLKKEKLNYLKFVEIVLKNLLGYEIRDIQFEEGNIEFSYANKEKRTVLGIEAKGTNTKDLFAEQKGYRKSQKTPIDQLWAYMGTLNLDYGIATNYKDFVLLDRAKGSSTYHFFDFEEVRNNEQKLKEFVAVFSRHQVIDQQFIEKLVEESAIEERNFTKEFYKLFHETRLMLVQEFSVNGAAQNEALHYAQLFLNRLMFVFFAQDTEKLKTRLFQELVISSLKSELLISEHSKLVSDTIISLFARLDKGSSTPTPIFGFNGGLFSEVIPPKIYFKDLREKSFFKAIYQNSQLKKELELDSVSKPIFERYQHHLNPIIKNLLVMASFDFKSEVSVNILGHIFEQSISDLEELKGGETSRRKKEGVFYTPEFITDYICRNTIIPHLSKSAAKTPIELVLEYADDVRELEKKLKELKILDPACGSGAFLIKAVDILLEINKELQLFKQNKGEYTAIKKGRKVKKDHGQLMLIKWNEEEEAREIIENSIYGVDLNEESVEITKLSLFLKIATKNRKLINLSNNIKCGNSLIDDPHIDLRAFDWKKQFNEILNHKKFDIVLGNPPYGADISKKEQAFFNDKYTTASYKLDSYGLFFERAVSLLAEGGYLGFIVPYTWLTIDQHKKLRQYLLNYNLLQIIDLPVKVFEDADLDTVITLLQKTKRKENFSVGEIQGQNIIVNRIKSFKEVVEHSDLLINLNINDEDVHIIKKMLTHSIKIADVFDVSQGYIPYRRSDLVVEYGKEKGNKIIDERQWHTFDKNTPADFKKELQGQDIGRYEHSWSGLKVKYGQWVAGYVQPKFFKSPRLVVREITRGAHYKIYATFVEEEYYNTPSIINIIDRQDKTENLLALLALINSRLYTFYHLASNPKAQAKSSIPKILIKDVKNLPLPESFITQPNTKKFASKAREMLELHEEKNKLSVHFLKLISSELKLQTPQKLQEWYSFEWAAFEDVLKKGKVRLSLKQKEELLELFESRRKDVLRLIEKIQLLDKEIDDMVYELYKITEKEQRIVEEE